MQCIVTCATGMHSCLSKISSEILVFNFGYLSSGHYTDVSTDVGVHSYFLKSKRGRE